VCGTSIKPCKEYLSPCEATFAKTQIAYKELIDETRPFLKDIHIKSAIRHEVKYLLFTKFFDNDMPAEKTMAVLNEYTTYMKILFS
jgi:hypothetical protein